MLLGRVAIKRIPWAQLFTEAVLVVLSVLLALALNSWRQGEINEDLAAQALHNIENEIRANKAQVEEALSYHEMLIDTLQSKNAPSGIALKSAFIQNNAWETAQATQAITYLNYNLASHASQIHELQEMYKQNIHNATQALYIGSNSGRQLAMVYDLRYLEQRLLKSYEEFLALTDT